MKITYETQGTCARFIDIETDGKEVKEVNLVGGCSGNANGLSALLMGMSIQDVIDKLKGIACRGTTSCPDQLASALEQMHLKQVGR